MGNNSRNVTNAPLRILISLPKGTICPRCRAPNAEFPIWSLDCGRGVAKFGGARYARLGWRQSQVGLAANGPAFPGSAARRQRWEREASNTADIQTASSVATP